MGGGHQQKQADQAFGAGSNAAGSSTATGEGLNATLFGTPKPGGGGMSGGTLSGMMNPASLDVTQPTGPYALQYNQAKAQGATNTDQAKQAIDREAGQRGFGTGAPSGYTGFLKSQADMSNAQNNGQLFSQFAGNSYQDALNNFWKATNTASGTANTQTGQGTGAYTNLYGTGQKAATDTRGQNIGILDSALSAGGTAASGAMTCLCEGTMLMLADGSLIAVQNVLPGMPLASQNGKENRVTALRIYEAVQCVKIEAMNGCTLCASRKHTIVLPLGGYARMEDALLQYVRTYKGPSIVRTMIDLGKQTVYQVLTDGSHDYLSSEFWSLE